MNSPLVSLVIPCYNSGNKVSRLFESILNQSYDNLQIIVVNDGSTDNTEMVAKNYSTRFIDKGFEYIYIYQENSGVGSACEHGLKYVKGEYLCWPDSDDYYEYSFIEKMLGFLEKNSDYSIVRCNAKIYYEYDLNHPMGTLAGNSQDRFKEKDLYLDYILEKSVYFAPICFMVRFSDLVKQNPELKLYHGKTGQNYQMILPLLFNSKFGYIDDCLSNYIVFDGSISHVNRLSYNQKLDRIIDKHNCIYETIKLMDIPDGEKKTIMDIVFQKLSSEKCKAAFDYGKKKKYIAERINVRNEYLVSDLKKPDLFLSIPLAFRFHYLLYSSKNTIRSISFLYKRLLNVKEKFKSRCNDR